VRMPAQPSTHVQTVLTGQQEYGPHDLELHDEDQSSDGDEQEAGEENTEAHSIIGVSIGPAQTRLTWPTTPAAEKAAALYNDEVEYFGGGQTYAPQFGEERGIYAPAQRYTLPRIETTLRNTPILSANGLPASRSPETLPSPWRAGSKQFERLDTTSGHPTQAAHRLRARASMELLDSTSHSRRGKQRSIPLPLLPKVAMPARSIILGISSAVAWFHSLDNNRQKGNAIRGNPSDDGSSLDSKTTQEISSSPTASSPVAPLHSSVRYHSPSASPSSQMSSPARPRPLRRSTSDNSFDLLQIMSRTSSLGDDTPWEHVHEQVNSRVKAIKDSLLANTSLRIPRMRYHPNLNFTPSWPDLSSSKRANLTKMKKEDSKDTSTVVSGGRFDETSREPVLLHPVGTKKNSHATHPHFGKAIRHLKGDVVILGGYRGSILRSAESPHHQLWVPIKVGLNLRKVNLEVPLHSNADEEMEDSIIPGGMLCHIGPVDISRRLLKRLRASKNARDGTLRVWDYGYDWRLNPHLLSRQLTKFLEDLQCIAPELPVAQRGATILAHSCGGLITRHAINARPELVNGVLYAGVPQTSVNILGPLRNGDEVLISSKVLTAQVNFSMRTTFLMLPLDGSCFLNRETKERYHVDFFDPRTWEEYRLSPCIARPLPVTAAPAHGRVEALVGSIASILPSLSLPGRRNSASKGHGSPVLLSTHTNSNQAGASRVGNHVDQLIDSYGVSQNHGMGIPMDNQTDPQQQGQDPETSVSTAVTISKDEALKYLSRTLAEVKQFKQELACRERTIPARRRHLWEIYPYRVRSLCKGS